MTNATQKPPGPHRVVVVGGGFAGLRAVRGLRGAPVEVTLVDRQNFTLFQPLVYQVATGALSPAEIAAPLRSVLRKQRNARVVLAEATGFDLEHREVVLDAAAQPGRKHHPRIRHADRRGRLAVQLLRPRRVAGRRARAEVARRRARHPQPDPGRLRGGRARARPTAAAGLADLRGGRRRPHRRGDGRADRRARAGRGARRLPVGRHASRARAAGRGLRPSADRTSPSRCREEQRARSSGWA